MPATTAYEPVVRAVTETHDPETARDVLTRRYVGHRAHVIGGAREFVFRSQAAGAGGLTVERGLYRAAMAIGTDPIRTVVAVTVLGGRFRVTAGRRHSFAVPGESLLCLPRHPLDVTIDHMLYRVVQLPAEVITRVATGLGVDAADFRFEGMTPISQAANQRWRNTVGYLGHLLSEPGPAGVPALLLNAAMETAAAAALTVFPNSTLTVEHLAGVGEVEPAVIRRAVAYIDAHAAEPITLDDIAAAAGLGVRAVQIAFRRHLDTTPLGYLRRVRLEQAHRDLQAADPTRGATVAGIARRWGFASPGRFAGHYRAVFGRSPSRTLQT